MVAETTKEPPQHRSKGGRKKGDSGFPLLTKLKARNLYLVQGATHEVIAKETGMTIRQSESLAARQGWTKARKAKERSLVATQDARAEGQISEALDAIASVSEQHAVQGLNRVAKALESKGKFAARDFQSWTGGVRNLVQTAKMCRETGDGANGVAGGANLNVFILRVGEQVQAKGTSDPVAEAKDVTPNGVGGNSAGAQAAIEIGAAKNAQ